MTQALIDQERSLRCAVPPLWEYAEARSLEQVNTLAAAGWRLHTPLLVPANGMKLYVMERARGGSGDGGG